MRYAILCACAVLGVALAANAAPMKTSSSGKCGKADVMQAIPAGDKEGHVFMVQQGKCVTTGEVAGVKSRDGAFSEHGEASGTHVKAWGVYTETFESGDMIFYSYTAMGTTKDKMVVTGGNKYTIIGGTGKMKGLKGAGTCATKGNAAGGIDYECTGEYTALAAAPAQ